MGKKRDKANDNIEILVDVIIRERINNVGVGNCCRREDRRFCCEKYQNDCSWCKDEWGEDMRENLLKKYIVT